MGTFQKENRKSLLRGDNPKQGTEDLNFEWYWDANREVASLVSLNSQKPWDAKSEAWGKVMSQLSYMSKLLTDIPDAFFETPVKGEQATRESVRGRVFQRQGLEEPF